MMLPEGYMAGGTVDCPCRFYDRWITRCDPRPVLVGVCFQCQIVEEVPVARTDVPMDVVVSELGVQYWRGG